METLKPVDVVIVGGGWTGLIMAKEIVTRTSHSVLVYCEEIDKNHGVAVSRKPVSLE